MGSNLWSVHDFIGNRGIAYWDAGVVLRSGDGLFSLLVPVASTANTFSGFIGADNVEGCLRIRYGAYSDTVRQGTTAFYMANRFRLKLRLSDTIAGLRFVESAVTTKLAGWVCDDMWAQMEGGEPIWLGTSCVNFGNYVHVTDNWDDIDGGGSSGGRGGGGGGGIGDGGSGGGGGGTNPPRPPEKPKPEKPKPEEPKKPCNDAATGKANPLMTMKLAPPNSNNIKGATFGDTRRYENGTPKFHNGIDFDARVGTPIYSMFTGTIGRIVSGQPNRVNGELPDSYTGDKDYGGNRIYVNAVVNGKNISVCYMHLQAGNAIAIRDPKTGAKYKTGDPINAGDVIGYTGITGNANPQVPHLHLSIMDPSRVGGNYKKNDKWIDPSPYLSAIINTQTTQIVTPCD